MTTPLKLVHSREQHRCLIWHSPSSILTTCSPRRRWTFILSIGKTKLKENMKQKVSNDLVLSSSLYTLVGLVEDSLKLSETVTYKNRIIESFVNLAKWQYKAILGPKALISKRGQEQQKPSSHKDPPPNQYQVKSSEIELQLMSLMLGIINSQTQTEDVHAQNIVALQSIMQEDLLSNMGRKLEEQMGYAYKEELSIVSNIRLESKFVTAELFTELVHQCFQLATFMKKHSQEINKQRQEHVLSNIQQANYADKQYMSILSHLGSLMLEGFCFKQCLAIMQQSLQLLTKENLKLFMDRNNQPLRVVLQKFISPSVSIEDSIQIAKFYINYANTHMGAKHLFAENIMHCITVNTHVTLIDQQDYYLTNHKGEQYRNPSHILWNMCLILIRTLNDHLIDNPDYLKALMKAIKVFESRIVAVLNFGNKLQISES